LSLLPKKNPSPSLEGFSNFPNHRCALLFSEIPASAQEKSFHAFFQSLKPVSQMLASFLPPICGFKFLILKIPFKNDQRWQQIFFSPSRSFTWAARLHSFIQNFSTLAWKSYRIATEPPHSSIFLCPLIIFFFDSGIVFRQPQTPSTAALPREATFHCPRKNFH